MDQSTNRCSSNNDKCALHVTIRLSFPLSNKLANNQTNKLFKTVISLLLHITESNHVHHVQ